MVSKQALSGALRLLGVTVIAGGTCLLAQRMVALSAATAEAASVLARAPQRSPTSAETEIRRLRPSTGSVQVVTDNIANASTFGFKRRRPEIGGANYAVSHPLDMTQGSLEATGNPLDIAISGDGLLHVKVEPTVADGTAYTRMGSLLRGANGDLLVNLGTGYALIPPINVPPGGTNIAIGQDGTVTYCQAGGSKVVVAGQIQLARFTAPEVLNTVGGLFTETAVSGPPMVAAPGDAGCGQTMQGYLEGSNVDTAKEYAFLLRNQAAW